MLAFNCPYNRQRPLKSKLTTEAGTTGSAYEHVAEVAAGTSRE